MITIRELAAIAGVSASTVSKALNHASDVSAETINRIQNLAVEYGYVKNTAGKTATGIFSGPRIALIYSDVISRYYSRVIQHFDRQISEKNGIMLACDAQMSATRAAQLCEYFESSGVVDGIICASLNADLDGLEILPTGKVPIAVIAYYQNLKPLPFDYICVNELLGIEEAIACLKQYGHERIAYLGEQRAGQRQSLFEQAMKNNGLPVNSNMVKISKKRFDAAGYETMCEILQQGGKLPTAIFCAYDDMAVGAAEAIFEAGYSVPKDFSIFGVDNTMRTIYNHKILASINPHIEEQVEIILAVLSRKINDPSYVAVQNISLQAEFIERETIGPCPCEAHSTV